MKIKMYTATLLSFALTASLTNVWAAQKTTTKLNFFCKNIGAEPTLKTILLAVSIHDFVSDQKSRRDIYASLETKRDLFDLSLKSKTSDVLESSIASEEVSGVFLNTQYQLTLSKPISPELADFEARLLFLVNGAPLVTGEATTNPQSFSCVKVDAQPSTISAVLKSAVDALLNESALNDWKVSGRNVSLNALAIGMMGKQIRQEKRVSDNDAYGSRVDLSVNGVKTTVFVVIITGEESTSMTAYTLKGELISSIDSSDK